jgi:hypothetical protein
VAPSVPELTPQITIPVSGASGFGNLTIAPPTFLEKWGVIFVSVGGIWMLAVCVAMLWYYLSHLAVLSAVVSASNHGDYKTFLDNYKIATDQLRDSITYAFDLMITKTVLPLVTLLLGYLFGKRS